MTSKAKRKGLYSEGDECRTVNQKYGYLELVPVVTPAMYGVGQTIDVERVHEIRRQSTSFSCVAERGTAKCDIGGCACSARLVV